MSVSYDDGSVVDCNFDVNASISGAPAPIAVCQDITVALDPTGIAIITSMDIDYGSTGDCGLQMNLSSSVFNCNAVGDNAVTLLIQDGNGNQSSCTSNVTVVDTIAPTCSVQDITVALDQFGNATILPEDIDLSSNGACGLQLLSVNPCSFYCEDAGNTIPVTLEMRDFVGNFSSCAANVMLIDPSGACSGALCGDGMQNGDELGVDCGGSFCGPCGTCPQQMHYDNYIIPNGTDEVTNHRITTSGIVETAGGVVRLTAKDYIEISSGFTIPANSNTEILIGDCQP